MGEFIAAFGRGFLFIGLPVTIYVFPIVGLELTKAQEWSVPAILAAVLALGFAGGRIDEEVAGGTMPTLQRQAAVSCDSACKCTMEWKTVRVPDASFQDKRGGSARPEERAPDYDAWVCDVCKAEWKYLN
jgi:hypothetical protein